MSNQLSLGRNLVVALAGLVGGILLAVGGLWIAGKTGIVSRADNTVLIAAAVGCLLLGVVPWRQKKPTPEGLAK